MQENEKINASGEMKSLEIGQTAIFNKASHKLTSIRTTAYLIKQDFGLEFSVFLSGDSIVVERVA